MPKITCCLAVCFSALIAFPLIPTTAVGADQHSVEAITAALKSPISPEAVAQARGFDDQIMSAGTVEGTRVYLVTDERSTRVNAMVTGLLRGAGQNPSEWIVRVLDTDPKLVNAFVAGGKYVYVYSGLIAQNPSDDELAFILSHELGHSLLKHNERRASDGSTSWAAVAGLAALFSDKNRDAMASPPPSQARTAVGTSKKQTLSLAASRGGLGTTHCEAPISSRAPSANKTPAISNATLLWPNHVANTSRPRQAASNGSKRTRAIRRTRRRPTPTR
jgi:predicted Zn-dependent protease